MLPFEEISLQGFSINWLSVLVHHLLFHDDWHIFRCKSFNGNASLFSLIPIVNLTSPSQLYSTDSFKNSDWLSMQMKCCQFYQSTGRDQLKKKLHKNSSFLDKKFHNPIIKVKNLYSKKAFVVQRFTNAFHLRKNGREVTCQKGGEILINYVLQVS